MDQLLQKLSDAGLVEGVYIQLDELQMVAIEDFVVRFGQALDAEDQYAALIALDDNGDGTTCGYKRFFDGWLAAAILEGPVEEEPS